MLTGRDFIKSNIVDVKSNASYRIIGRCYELAKVEKQTRVTIGGPLAPQTP